jgi:hypothetical protein
MSNPSLIDNMKEAADSMYAQDRNQRTLYMGSKEYEAQQKREQFRQICQAKAAEACHLLRKQLRQQELERLFQKVYNGVIVPSDFVFVSKQEFKKLLETKQVIIAP